MSEIKNDLAQPSPIELPRFDQAVEHQKRHEESEVDMPKLPTAEEISAIREAAREEGFNQGYSEGLEKAQTEYQQLKQDFEQLMLQFAQPLEQERESVIEQLAELCILVTRQIIRREIQHNPEQVIAVVRDAIKLLPAARRRVTIQMHPEDANLLRKIFSLENQPSSSWSIAEDPSIARGGCMVTTETSKIDATIEKRISEIFAHVFGDLRALANDKADEAINLTSQSSSKHQEDSQQPFHTEPSAYPQSTHTENRNSDEGQQHGLQPQDDSNSNLRQDPLEFGKEPDENG